MPFVGPAIGLGLGLGLDVSILSSVRLLKGDCELGENSIRHFCEDSTVFLDVGVGLVEKGMRMK